MVTADFEIVMKISFGRKEKKKKKNKTKENEVKKVEEKKKNNKVKKGFQCPKKKISLVLFTQLNYLHILFFDFISFYRIFIGLSHEYMDF